MHLSMAINLAIVRDFETCQKHLSRVVDNPSLSLPLHTENMPGTRCLLHPCHTVAPPVVFVPQRQVQDN